MRGKNKGIARPAGAQGTGIQGDSRAKNGKRVWMEMKTEREFEREGGRTQHY